MLRAICAVMIGVGATGPAMAQLSLPSMVSGLPNVSSMSAGNAAGVLHYCMKNQLVSSTSAETVLTKLEHKPQVKSSHDYAAGASGQILGGSKPMSIAGMQPHMKSQACGMVLKPAKHLL